MACPHVESCPLYPVFGVKSLLRVWQLSYCEGDHSRCARFQLSLAGATVPATLLPNGVHLKPRRTGDTPPSGVVPEAARAIRTSSG